MATVTEIFEQSYPQHTATVRLSNASVDELTKLYDALNDHRLDIEIARESHDNPMHLDLSEAYFDHLEDEMEIVAEWLASKGGVATRSWDELIDNPKVQRLLDLISYGKHGSLVGGHYGSLDVMSHHHSKEDGRGRTLHYWMCLCACGETHTASTHQLRNEGLRDCGCGIDKNAVDIELLDVENL